MEIVAVHDQKKPPERPVVAGKTAVTLIGGGALARTICSALDDRAASWWPLMAVPMPLWQRA
jgi:hypothetical protein